MAYLTSFDTRQLRNVLGTFPTGVTIVTTRGRDGVAHGVTANSFSSISLDPPLVLWSQALTSKSLEAFQQSDHFAINILADDQVALSNYFAKSTEDKFAGVEHTLGLGDVPVLPGTAAHFECVKVAEHPGGDHVVYFGRVERVSHSGRRPLAFAHGKYMVPYAHELGPVALAKASTAGASAAQVDALTQALPELRAAAANHPVGVAVWGNHGPTMIRCDAAFSMHAGQVVSLTASAAGLAFAAFLPTEITKPFVDEDLRLLRVADEDEAEQRQRFVDQVETARQVGYASAETGNGAICVPLMGSQNTMIAAVVTVGLENPEQIASFQSAVRKLGASLEPLP